MGVGWFVNFWCVIDKSKGVCLISLIAAEQIIRLNDRAAGFERLARRGGVKVGADGVGGYVD